MSNKQAREAVFKLVYERCISGEDNQISFENYTQEFENSEKEFCTLVYKMTGKLGYGDFLTEQIERFSQDFKIDRIFKIDLAILLVAFFEILYTDISCKIAANEAVELAKKYSTEKSYKFINGMISTVIENKDKILQGSDV
ncbi:MAG: transcription antitermination factor NusB [Firmicutes bacterium]|nr:transcription antitermination factor NusB [Bacillota bacterium]